MTKDHYSTCGKCGGFYRIIAPGQYAKEAPFASACSCLEAPTIQERRVTVVEAVVTDAKEGRCEVTLPEGAVAEGIEITLAAKPWSGEPSSRPDVPRYQDIVWPKPIDTSEHDLGCSCPACAEEP